MRRLLVFAAVIGGLVSGTVPAAAQSCTSSKLGTYTYTNCSDGTSATTTQLGNYGFTNYSDGTSATRTQLGNYGYTNYSNGTSATSTQLGNYGFTNYSDGGQATSVRIGNYVYTTYSDGTTVTSWVGGTTSSTTSTATQPAAPMGQVVPAVPAVPVVPAAPAIAAPYGVQASVNGSLMTLPPGLFVKGSGPAIYIIWNGQRWTFQSWQTFLAYGGAADFHNVAILADSDLAPIPLGPDVPTR